MQGIRFIRTVSSLLLMMALLSFNGMHKFYVSIYQINYAKERKMLQITSRIFVDDLNQALSQHANQATYFGEKEQSPRDEAAFKQYMKKHLLVSVDGRVRELTYHSSEIEGNIVISYFSIREIPKVGRLQVKCTALTEVLNDQQNIIQLTVNSIKRNMLLTGSDPADSVTF